MIARGIAALVNRFPVGRAIERVVPQGYRTWIRQPRSGVARAEAELFESRCQRSATGTPKAKSNCFQ